ncbi:hypothetical protein RB195_020356 [Necator americanus]
MSPKFNRPQHRGLEPTRGSPFLHPAEYINKTTGPVTSEKNHDRWTKNTSGSQAKPPGRPQRYVFAHGWTSREPADTAKTVNVTHEAETSIQWQGTKKEMRGPHVRRRAI